MTSQELKQLIDQKETLTTVLTDINKVIKDQQIIQEKDMNLFGFKKLTEGSSIVLYGKQFANKEAYEIMLDLIQPNLVSIKRNKQTKMYGFDINSIEEFRELLMFISLI